MGYHPRTHQVIIFGGQGGGIRSDTWLYSVASRNWTRVVSATSPQARFSMVYGMDYRRDRFLISTGEGNGKVFFNDVWAFDFGSLQWSRVATVGTRPSKRYGSAGGVYQFDPTRLYVSHGFSDRRFEDTFYLDLEVTPHRWVQVDATSSVPHARCLHAGAVLSDDRLVLWGGCGSGGHGPCPANDAWMLHAASDASFGARRGPWWLKHGFSGTPKVFPTMVLSPHNSVVSSRYVVMYGGKGGLFYGNGDGGDIGVLDVDTGDWTWIHADGGAGGKPSTLLGPGLVLVTEGSNTTISTGDYVLMFGGSSSNKMWMLEIDEAQSSKGDEFSPPFLFDYRLTHGLLMTLSWGILLPFGGTFARFYRHIPDALWFRVHRPVQAFGVVVSIVGLLMMLLGMVAGHISAVPHAFIGVFVMFLGILQPVNAYFRPHVHAGEPKTRGRVYWEYLHKYSGRVAMFLGMINPFWGLAHIHASTSFVVLYSIWFGGFVVFYVVKTLRGEPENSPFAQWCNTHILGGRWKEQASQSVPKKTDNPSTENMVTMGNMGN